jgi:16S rRNA (cytidine1402-2'-O)-methyltransferase
MLYLVPTPLGNLEDMPPRALRALREVSAVYCEDTRRTRVLMTHFGISKPLIRYEERFGDEALERLKRGEDLALVSDGGMPCISDPGRKLVEQARRSRIQVTALPGGTALATAVAGSGLPGDSFIFLGFLPRSAGKRKKALAEAAALGKTLVVYESPFRVLELLDEVQETLGPDAQVCAARELTKVYEEWLTGTPASVAAELKNRKEILGEFVVVLHPEKAPS